jgi:glycosyltransferase involved in cell wall biosynthesis
MKLHDARIGYAGYSRDFSVPGDRRRFAAYARMKGLPIEHAVLSRDYDLAYVTYSSDLPGWVARKRREGDRLKLVFELIDSYFTETGRLRRLAKGTARYLLGTDSRLSPNLRHTLIAAAEHADAVICSTEEQRETIARYNANVFTSFDHFGDELGSPKVDYRRDGPLRLAWEGQSTTLGNIQSIRGVLNGLRKEIELHVVTDPKVYRYFGRFDRRDSRDALRGIECPIHFHPWHRGSFANQVTAADAAIIPIDLCDAMARGKPENKLVMLWQLGMPVLASDTPAYRRAMSGAGIGLTCASEEEWSAHLEALIAADGADLERIGRQCRTFAETAYSKAEFLRRFDLALETVGFSPN